MVYGLEERSQINDQKAEANVRRVHLLRWYRIHCPLACQCRQRRFLFTSVKENGCDVNDALGKQRIAKKHTMGLQGLNINNTVILRVESVSIRSSKSFAIAVSRTSSISSDDTEAGMLGVDGRRVTSDQ
jgi:hypothetical protein